MRVIEGLDCLNIGNHLDNYKKLIGKKIQARRVQLGIGSQEALGALVGVDQSYVSRWERGLHLPEGRHREKLLEVLGSDESLLDITEKLTLNHSDRNQLILDIQSRLTALDNDQLEALLIQIDTFAPSSASATNKVR
jgi:transcriptional regulator with XRE-family HTH domain